MRNHRHHITGRSSRRNPKGRKRQERSCKKTSGKFYGSEDPQYNCFLLHSAPIPAHSKMKSILRADMCSLGEWRRGGRMGDLFHTLIHPR